MRKLLALLLLTTPAYAQQQSIDATAVFPIQSDSTTLLAAADAVTLSLSGQQWASAVWVVSTAGSGGITTEYTNDPRGKASTNWLASPYARRLDQTTANPSVAPWANNTPVAGTFETPLPGNATAFRIRYQTAGTATIIQITAGAAFVPGIVVDAILYDVTSGTASALDTGTLDMAGWQQARHFFTMNGGTPAFSMQEVDDAGTSTANLITSAAAFQGGLGGFSPNGTAGIFTAAAVAALPKRMRYQSGAITSQTSRIRIEVRR